MSQGFIKLHRRLLEWEWYTHQNVKSVFVHLLLLANHKDNKWRGIFIKKGQLVTSISNLSSQLKLSEKVIRNCLKKLMDSGELGKRSTSKFSLITINNWSHWQGEGYTESDLKMDRQTKDKQGAGKGLSNDNRGATNKNDNNEKKDKNYLFSKSEKSEIRNTIVYEFGLNPVIKSEQNKIENYVKGFLAKGATVHSLKELSEKYKFKFPEMPHTPKALLNNWDYLEKVSNEQNQRELEVLR